MGGLLSSSTPKFDPTKDLADLTGKVAIVTGGKRVEFCACPNAERRTYQGSRYENSSGIGYTTVQNLARHGAKVYIGARSEERAKAAIERLRAEGLEPGNGELEWLALDLSDPRKVKESAEAFLGKEDRLDILGRPLAISCVYHSH